MFQVHDRVDRYLPQVMGAYNSTQHSTTGVSPHMMLTGHEKSLPLTFFYPEYEGKKTSPQVYVRDVIRRQQELNDLCRRNTQQAQARQRKKFDKKAAGAKAYSVGDYVWVFQNERDEKAPKKWRGPFMITEVHQEGRFYRLSTGRAAHYENIKPHNPSTEDWCIAADMEEGDYLMMDPACEVNEKGTREKNDGNEVIEEGKNTPLDLDPNEVIEADDETLPYAEEDWQDPEHPKTLKSNQIESNLKNRMDNFNLDELLDMAEAYVGPMIDAIYRRLMDRDFALEDPEVVMLLTALINILGHDNRGDRPMEVLLMAAYGERGVLDRPIMRVMRWRNGALSGSDLANEPRLGSSKTYQSGEMPMPSKLKPGLTRMHQEINSEAASSGSPLRAAVPPKRAKVGQKVQTNQTMQDLDGMKDELERTKRELDEMTRTMLITEEDRDTWKRLFEDCNKKQGQEIERLRQD